ncbi:MAG: phosphodiester glycosidase family protein [Armatimonadetes bacterium]|nr:phosphodiester glycosidase family protein [Armatimonadota bacterium]
MRWLRAALYVGWLLALAGCQAVAPPPAGHAARPAPAKPAAPALPAGFDVLRVALGDQRNADQAVQVVAARADLHRMRVRVVTAPANRSQWPRAAEVARQQVALAAINGGYFDERNRPLGLVVSDGKVVNRLRRADWGVFEVRDGRAQVVHTKKFAGTSGVEQALQCGPRLVAGGQPTKLKESLPDERAAIGVDAEGRVLLAATTRGRLSLSAFAAVLARPVGSGGLGCRDATNLDGGPSAQLCIPGAADLRGVYGMPTHVIVEERPPSHR